MTGIDEHNYPEFNRVEQLLASWGWSVLNPAQNFCGRDDLPYDWYIREDLKLMSFADAIVFLPHWKDSKGCCLEFHAAMVLGLDIYEWNNFDELQSLFLDHEYVLIQALLSQAFYKPVDEMLKGLDDDADSDQREDEIRQDEPSTRSGGILEDDPSSRLSRRPVYRTTGDVIRRPDPQGTRMSRHLQG